MGVFQWWEDRRFIFVSQVLNSGLLQMEEIVEKEEEITLEMLERCQVDLNNLYEANINLRMKYPTEPMRFYQSQEDIDNLLQNLQSTTQDHIPIVVQSKVLSSVLKLLNHPNQDINISCIQFLHELISEEPDKDEIFEVYYRMCAWLVENGLYDSLVETLNKMNEEESVEEYEVSLKILKILQTLTEQLESSLQSLVKETKILEYLSNRVMPNYVVKHKVIDDNKFVGSDLLVFILSNSQSAQLRFHELCGMQILIQSIRPYLSKVPASNDEKQYLGNLFDCLNILLINNAEEMIKSRIVYHKMKGNQIMLQFMKTKTENSVSSLKAIANSFIGLDKQAENKVVEELIDFGGLKYIFAIVLRQGLKGKDFDQQMMIDQNCLRIVLIMLVSTSQIYKMRVQAKLSEKRFVKLQKMFEIRAQYLQNVGKDALKESSPQQYFERLKDGLGIVEIIDKIFCNLIFCASTVRQKLVMLMKLYGVLAQEIEFILKNRYGFIGEGAEKREIQKLIVDHIPAIAEQLVREVKQPQNE